MSQAPETSQGEQTAACQGGRRVQMDAVLSPVRRKRLREDRVTVSGTNSHSEGTLPPSGEASCQGRALVRPVQQSEPISRSKLEGPRVFSYF